MPARIADQLVGLSAAQIKAVLTLAVPKHPDRAREEQAAPPRAPPSCRRADSAADQRGRSFRLQFLILLSPNLSQKILVSILVEYELVLFSRPLSAKGRKMTSRWEWHCRVLFPVHRNCQPRQAWDALHFGGLLGLFG
jgi:hypothetical protein